MRRTAWIAAALLASHGAALWLGRNSPVSEAAADAKPGSPVAAAKKPGAENLTAFLRRSEQVAASPEPDAEEEQDEEALLAAAKAAIPVGADVAALVKAAADPDSLVSIETRAAFGLWVDRDPVAALRWLAEWRRDSYGSRGLDAEFALHLQQGGLAKLGFYLREVPQARDFLLSAATEESVPSCFGEVSLPSDKVGSAEVLQVAATLESPSERLSFLLSHFSDTERCLSHLPQIRALLDDRSAAKFLAELHGGDLSPGQAAALEGAGFPPHALAHFLHEHLPAEEPVGIGRDLSALGTPMDSRTNADFIGTVANMSIPGVPESIGTNVTDIVTGGLRSGDGPINRNNIDAVLNNPNRSAQPPQPPSAETIRNALPSGNVVSLGWFPEQELAKVPTYAESREDFLRGKITGEEWVSRLQGEIPGAGDLRDGISAMAFRLTVEDDPRRAMSLLDAANPHRILFMDLPDSVPPEVLFSMADLLCGDGEMPEDLKRGLSERLVEWITTDPESLSAMYDKMPPAVERAFFSSRPDEGDGKREEEEEATE